MYDRETAQAELHDAIARMHGWAVGPCQYHGETASWHVSAINLKPRGRHASREAINGDGGDRDRRSRGVDRAPRGAD